jgi:hypothetical protein
MSDIDELINMTNTLTLNNNNEYKNKLKTILSKSKIDHKKEILKEDDLKLAHIYCKINELSGQETGPLIEHYIKIKYKMIKNDTALCIGDLKSNNINIEIKVSNGGKSNNKFNYVQIRMNHECDYIFTAYYINENNIDNLGELFIFKLKKSDIKNLILKYGCYAHGTISKLGKISDDDLNNINNKKEYALRPVYDDKCWNELLKFRINEIII